MTAVAAQYPHVHLKVCPDMGVAVGKMQMMFHLRCHGFYMSPSRVNSYLYHLGVIDLLLRVRLQQPEIVSAVPRELLVLRIDLVCICQ